MRQNADLRELTSFLLDFATTLLGYGAPTSRVVRGTMRIAQAFGHGVDLAVFPKHIMMTVFSGEAEGEGRTWVREIRHRPFNFEILLRLNSLSWNAHDNHLSLATLRARYEGIIAHPSLSRWLVLVLVACANASFCRLFGGDAQAMGVVFVATLAAFFLRQEMFRQGLDARMTFMVSAFVASLVAAAGGPWAGSATPEIALGASVLFLIPGVPLINAVNDILEGFVLMGFARAINAGILIVCIALGLSGTLMLMGTGGL